MNYVKNKFFFTAKRSVSINKIRFAVEPIQSISSKEKYYQRIGNVENDSKDTKPEGWSSAKPFSKIPGPKPFPLIGNIFRFLPGGEYHNIDLISLHRLLQKTYGELVMFGSIFGKSTAILSYNPADTEIMFRNEGPWPIREALESFAYYRNHVRKDIFQGVGGTLASHGEEWFRFRSIVNKILMQPRTAEMYVDGINDVAEDFVKRIRFLSDKSTINEMPEDFLNELYKFFLESISFIGYNKRLGILDGNLREDSEQQKYINSITEMLKLMYRLDVLPSLWRYFSTPNWRRYVKVLDFITEKNLQSIEECLKNSSKDESIPDHERSVLERLTKIDKKVALSMIMDMISAGVDTTGRTMGAVLYFIARNPEVQKKLKQEVLTYLPEKDTPITKEILKNLQYVRATIKETMRLSPTAIGTARTTVKDLVLAGYQIPKGTNVVVISIVNSRKEEHFKRAEEFLPDRWLRTTNSELSRKDINPFVMLPFGFGPRSCVGKRLANMEMEVGLAKIIRNFNIAWTHPEAQFGASDVLYGIQSPLKLKMEQVAE